MVKLLCLIISMSRRSAVVYWVKSLLLMRRNQLFSLFMVVFVYISLITRHRKENAEVKAQKLSEYFNDSLTEIRYNTSVVIQSAAPSWNESRVTISTSFLKYLVSRLHNSSFPGTRNYSEYTLIRMPERFRTLPDVQPLRTDFGPVVNDVTSFRYPIDIPSCQDRGRDVGIISLFLVVISAPSYFDKRDAIRKTWLGQLMQFNVNKTSVRLMGHFFIVGLTSDGDIHTRIEEESSKHGDILQVDIIDTYARLTSKVTGALNWINSHCSRADFVLKVDDDVYLNTRNLISTLRNLNSSHQSIYGTSADGVVRRDGKFRVSVDMWPWSNYPPYCMGAFLLMSGCIIEPLLAAAQTTPYFPFEDTYIGLCADKAGVKMRFSRRALGGFLTRRPEPCHIHNAISWLTQSVDVVYKSHIATEDFYKNVTRCIMHDPILNSIGYTAADPMSLLMTPTDYRKILLPILNSDTPYR